MDKTLKAVLLVFAAIVFGFGSGIGQNRFVPSSLAILCGTVLTVITASIIELFLLRRMLDQQQPVILALFISLICTAIYSWTAFRLVTVALPDLYTRNYGATATMQIHPTRILHGLRAPLQAEVREIPVLVGNIYLFDAPPRIKYLYRVTGPVHSTTSITLTGLRSVFGFHKTGFSG